MCNNTCSVLLNLHLQVINHNQIEICNIFSLILLLKFLIQPIHQILVTI